MNKVCILSNHIYPFHVGGSEIVIKNISEKLNQLGNKVSVYGWDVKKDIVSEGVEIKKLSTDKFEYILLKYESIIIYSDAFLQLSQFLKLNEKYKKSIILFPVGFTGCRSSTYLTNQVFKKDNNITFVCHDDFYIDAEMLRDKNISYSIITNGISDEEFNKKVTKNLSSILKILCVANTFPKKGHSELFKVCDLLKEKYTIDVSVYCHTPSWDVGKRMQNQIVHFSKTKSYKCNINIDKPRSEVVNAYYENDIFIFCSLKEVAPLCILESCASGLPWVSFDVGNVSQLRGGLVNSNVSKDHSGYVISSDESIKNHVCLIDNILDPNVYYKKSEEGIDFVKDKTWQSIAKQYEHVIKNSRKKT